MSIFTHRLKISRIKQVSNLLYTSRANLWGALSTHTFHLGDNKLKILAVPGMQDAGSVVLVFVRRMELPHVVSIIPELI